jgi:hypothetical protein
MIDHVVGGNRMKNRMHTGLVRDCVHPLYMSASLVVSDDVGYHHIQHWSIYHGLRFSELGMKTK